MITLYHSRTLPLVLSYDSQLYIDQALMLGTPRFWNDWHFLRTPLFQTITRLCFIVFGENSWVLIAITTTFGFFGLLLLQRILSKITSSNTAWALTLLCACSPLLIAYEHCFLTETGTFFFLSAIILSALSCLDARFSSRSCLAYGLVVAVGYYFRPTLVVLSVSIPLLYLLLARSRNIKDFARVAFLTLIVPHLLSLPWRYLGKDAHWEGDQIIFGLINQAVFEPDSPLLGAAQPAYLAALRHSLIGGHLSPSGIGDGDIYQFISLLHAPSHDHPTRFFLQVISTHPVRYLKGILRGELYLLGAPGIDSDNDIFQRSVFQNGGSVIFSGPPRIEQYVRSHFEVARQKNIFFERLASLLSPLYQWLFRLGSAMLIPLLCVAYKKRLQSLFVLCLIPFIFISYHAVVLFSLDRMAVPAIPFITCLAGLLVFSPCQTMKRIEKH